MDGQFRTSDDSLDRPLQLQVRYEQLAKYGRVVEENSLRFNPAISLSTGHRIHKAFKRLIKD